MVGRRSLEARLSLRAWLCGGPWQLQCTTGSAGREALSVVVGTAARTSDRGTFALVLAKATCRALPVPQTPASARARLCRGTVCLGAGWRERAQVGLGAVLRATFPQASSLHGHAQTTARPFGVGRGFLLIHGLGGTPAEMRFVARGLARAGPPSPPARRPLRQLRGPARHRLEGLVSLGSHGLRELRRTCQNVIVGGLSMGAMLPLHLAAEYPCDVHATTLFAPTLKLDGWGVPGTAFSSIWCGGSGGPFRPFGRTRALRHRGPALHALVTAAINSGDSSKAGQICNPGRVMLEMRRLVTVVRRELPRIRQPTLIIHPRHAAGPASAMPPICRARSPVWWRHAFSMIAISHHRGSSARYRC